MTTQGKLVRRKLSLLELAEYLNNVSQACKVKGFSRQHFYDIKQAFDEHRLEGLVEKTRKKPCMNRVVQPARTGGMSGESGEVMMKLAEQKGWIWIRIYCNVPAC